MSACPGVKLARPGSRTTAAALAAVVAFFHCVVAAAETAPRYRPADKERTLIVLPGAASRSAEPGADADDAARQAEDYLRLARTTNDARYFGRAEAAIQPWRDRASVPVSIDLVAADLAQQRHEFDSARRRLDRVLAANPRNVEARLMRANIGLLLGEFESARRDCLAVLQAGAALPGTICLATALTGPGSLERARRLAGSLDVAHQASPGIAHWRLLTEADLALRAGDAHAALSLLEQAHALDAGNEEARTRLAELMLGQRQPVRALALANGPNASLARLVVRLRAAEALDDPRAIAIRREIDDMLAVARRRGAARHHREEALLALHADRDAVRALALARKNFELQKDTSDLRLLVDAALTAGDRETLRSTREWLTATGFQDRVVDALLRKAGA